MGFQSCDNVTNAESTRPSVHEGQRKMIKRLRKTINKFSWVCSSCQNKNTVIDDTNPFKLRDTCAGWNCGCHRDGETIQVGQPFWKKLRKVHMLAARFCRMSKTSPLVAPSAECTGDEPAPVQDESAKPTTAPSPEPSQDPTETPTKVPTEPPCSDHEWSARGSCEHLETEDHRTPTDDTMSCTQVAITSEAGDHRTPTSGSQTPQRLSQAWHNVIWEAGYRDYKRQSVSQNADDEEVEEHRTPTSSADEIIEGTWL